MQTFFQASRTSKDPQSLWSAFLAYFRAHAIDALCVVQDPPVGAPDANVVLVGAYGLPEWFVQAYRERLHRSDPAHRYARTHSRPFFWSRTPEIRPFSDDEKTFLLEFEKLGIGEWLSIPVFGPHGRNGYLGLATPPPDQISESDLREFQAVAQMGHQRYCELQMENFEAPVALSRREREILEWVARGKSNTTIAGILGISRNTVDTHLRRTYEKLSVTDRTVAAVRGISLGLISP